MLSTVCGSFTQPCYYYSQYTGFGNRRERWKNSHSVELEQVFWTTTQYGLHVETLGTRAVPRVGECVQWTQWVRWVRKGVSHQHCPGIYSKTSGLSHIWNKPGLGGSSTNAPSSSTAIRTASNLLEMKTNFALRHPHPGGAGFQLRPTPSDSTSYVLAMMPPKLLLSTYLFCRLGICLQLEC